MLLIAEYVVPVSSEPIEHGAVFIKDGAIADIGDAEMIRLRYPNEEVKDFGMAALTPGFIDLHARMEDAVFRGLVHDLPFVQWRKEIAALRKRISYAEAFDSAFLGRYHCGGHHIYGCLRFSCSEAWFARYVLSRGRSNRQALG